MQGLCLGPRQGGEEGTKGRKGPGAGTAKGPTRPSIAWKFPFLTTSRQRAPQLGKL